ncbi:MAG: hypothetical protein LBJ48_01305 [Coriobacteriales bacterium]|jgi:hypothetical protein|nr:hypothetical protein [Coriobacteriales bacterium]
MTDSTDRRRASDRLAFVVRVITVPPVLVSALLILLYLFKAGVFASLAELALSLVFLVLIPLAAYPVSAVVPGLKKKGREGQRNLALALSLVGYAGAVVYGMVTQVSNSLFLIYVTYFLSVLILLLFNKVLGIRASGHACGIMGPLVFLVYFIGPYGIIACVAVAALVIWSSLYLKRHSPGELIWGAASALIAFVLSLLAIVIL